MKESGYRDSCADIAVALAKLEQSPSNTSGIEVVLPKHDKDALPSETDDAAWSCESGYLEDVIESVSCLSAANKLLLTVPDTEEGIRDAINRGANTLWLNTVIHRKHPLFKIYKPVLDGSSHSGIRFVGQLPEHSEDYDDKAVVNPWLAKIDETKTLADGFPKSLVLSQKATSTEEGFTAGMKRIEEELGLPCVLKVSILYFLSISAIYAHPRPLAANQGKRVAWRSRRSLCTRASRTLCQVVQRVSGDTRRGVLKRRGNHNSDHAPWGIRRESNRPAYGALRPVTNTSAYT